MYLFIFDDMEFGVADIYDGDDVRSVHEGVLSIIDISDPTAPKWLNTDNMVAPWVDVEKL